MLRLAMILSRAPPLYHNVNMKRAIFHTWERNWTAQKMSVLSNGLLQIAFILFLSLPGAV